MPIDFANLPLWLNILLFALAAGAVWLSGTRLSHLADAIARRYGLGHAAVGVLLLGGITSLPEIAVAGTASISGNAPLAVNNLLGGFTMQVAILALADLALRRRALTSAIPNPTVMLQGTLGILLVAIVAVGIGVGDIGFLGAGLWTWLVFGLFLYALRLMVQAEEHPSWQIVGPPPAQANDEDDSKVDGPQRALILKTVGAAGIILVMGFLLSQSGEAIAEQSGLGSSFFGAVFIAISTSLPEISTVLAAMRLGRYVMAVSDIFGTNLFDIGLIFVVDLLFRGGPVLNDVGMFSIVAALLGIFVTAIYLVGLIERRDVAIFGVGVDSIAVAVAYLGGVALLYTLR